jgi:uncharacterized protein YjbJ (UPF0337 family)
MSTHSLTGRYYEVLGKIREWLGTVSGNELATQIGRHDRLVGKIAREHDVSLAEAELIVEDSADELQRP